MSAHPNRDARGLGSIRSQNGLRFNAIEGFTSTGAATTLRPMRASIAVSSLVALLGVGCYRANERVELPDAFIVIPDAQRPDAHVEPILPDAGRDVGPISTCRRPLDCPGQTCVLDTRIPPVDLADVPLTCGAPVGSGDVAAQCDANSDCRENLCALAGGCVVPCIDASDCMAGHQCARIPIVTSSTTLQFAQACTPWIAAPSSTTVVQNETVSAMRGGMQDFPITRFDAPSRLSMFVADRDDDNRFVFTLRTAGGTQLFDVNTWSIAPQANPAVAFFQSATVLMPSGMRDVPRGDDYVVNLVNGNAAQYRRITVDRTAPGASIALNFIYVGVSRASATPFVMRMIDRYSEIVTSMGLIVGSTRFTTMPGALATQHSLIESQSEVGDLLRLSAGAGRPTLNVFLVRSSTEFLGISGGIPGAINVHGTSNSGIVLTIEELQAIEPMLDEGFAGVVLAHELGHYQGFPHTSEADGTVLDVFDDTPACGLTRDDNGDGMLDPFECRDFGADYVMFWQGVFSSGRFSPRQQELLRNSTALQ